MIDELNKLKIEYIENANLLNYNTMKLNSKCFLLVYPNDLEELTSVIDITKKYKYKYFILGNGSNVIIPNYYDGVIIKLTKFNKMTKKYGSIYVEAGYMLNKLATDISNLGYTSLEWATFIPGTIGGAVYSNAGAYNSSISDVLVDAVIFDGKDLKTYSRDELKFGYRTSILQENKNLILIVCNLKVKKGNIKEIKSLILERHNKRVATQDLKNPSCGSVFRNPTEAPAGKLIDDLNLKGTSIGGAMVSNIHANFIINKGNATYDDVVSLIKLIKNKVKENYNIDLILEQEIIK